MAASVELTEVPARHSGEHCTRCSRTVLTEPDLRRSTTATSPSAEVCRSRWWAPRPRQPHTAISREARVNQRQSRRSKARREPARQHSNQFEVRLGCCDQGYDCLAQHLPWQHRLAGDLVAPALGAVSIHRDFETRLRRARRQMRELVEQREYSRLHVFVRVHRHNGRVLVSECEASQAFLAELQLHHGHATIFDSVAPCFKRFTRR